MRSSRRQNVACDTCRKSKRRCTSKHGRESVPDSTCLRCSRLGQSCTWVFATAHAVGRKVARKFGQDVKDEVKERQRSSIDGPIPPEETAGASCAVASAPSAVASISGNKIVTSALPAHKPNVDDQAAQHRRMGGDSDVIHTHDHELMASGSASTLNSFTINSLLECQLSRIRDITQGWCTDRFLARDSNPFQGPFNYILDTRLSGPDDRKAAVTSIPPLSDLESRVTLLGAAILLDSSADLYGNTLTRQDRNAARRAYHQALKTLCTQWLPYFGSHQEGYFDSTQPDTDSLLQKLRVQDLYSAHWGQAQRMLAETKPSASFTRILAVLTLSLAAVPDQALSRIEPGYQPSDLLDHALVQLQTLLRLVRGFISRLPPASTYRRLLGASCSTLHWFAYLRDTSTSAVSCRRIMLQDVSLPDAPASDSDLEQASEDIFLDLARRRLIASFITLWRKTLRLEDMLSGKVEDIQQSLLLLRSCSRLIETCDATEVRVLEVQLGPKSCVDSAAITTVFILSNYNYGILKVAQECRRMQSHADSAQAGILLQQIIDKLDVALLRSMSLVADALTPDEPRATDASEIPVVAHSSSLTNIARMLVAFVDHALDIRRPCGLFERPQNAPVDRKVDAAYIWKLLQGLSTLNRSAHGSSDAPEALRDLMSRHGIWLNCGQRDPDDGFS